MKNLKLKDCFQPVSGCVQTMCRQAWDKVAVSTRAVGRQTAKAVRNLLLDETAQDLAVYGGAALFIVFMNYHNHMSLASQLNYGAGVIVCAAIVRDRLRHATNQVRELERRTEQKKDKVECTMS